MCACPFNLDEYKQLHHRSITTLRVYKGLMLSVRQKTCQFDSEFLCIYRVIGYPDFISFCVDNPKV